MVGILLKQIDSLLPLRILLKLTDVLLLRATVLADLSLDVFNLNNTSLLLFRSVVI